MLDTQGGSRNWSRLHVCSPRRGELKRSWSEPADRTSTQRAREGMQWPRRQPSTAAVSWAHQLGARAGLTLTTQQATLGTPRFCQQHRQQHSLQRCPWLHGCIPVCLDTVGLRQRREQTGSCVPATASNAAASPKDPQTPHWAVSGKAQSVSWLSHHFLGRHCGKVSP